MGPDPKVASSVLSDINLLKHHRGSGYAFADGTLRKPSRYGSPAFSARANNLWRVSQGSNSVVLKKIYRGGTHTPKQLANQFNYLFGKSTGLFGNMVEHDAEGRTLTAEERQNIIDAWSDGWGRDTKNGQTTHLLVSFPADLKAEKARKIAEIWAVETFQTGHTGVPGTDEWAYVAALHTDRANPHVHIVVNNRGLEQGEWFYMAQDHVHNLHDMKERLVAIAADMGVTLDSSSRLDRGVLTYGPSRAEIEAARREDRPVHEKPLQGRALRNALSYIGQGKVALRALASFASAASLDDISANLDRAAEILERGGVITPAKMELKMDIDNVQTRADLAKAFPKWLEDVETEIGTRNPAEQAELRKDLANVTSLVLRDLGDAEGAELAKRRPVSEIYRTQQTDDRASRDGAEKTIGTDAATEIRNDVLARAEQIGFDRDAIASRLAQPADNAWQERQWVVDDLQAVAKHGNLDLDNQADRYKAADLVDNFYEKAAASLNRVLESEHGVVNDRLQRTLGAMANSLEANGSVEFEREDDAERFATALKERYGEDVVERIAAGDDRALAVDFPDPAERRQVALGIVAAAEKHESVGMSLREAEQAKELLREEVDKSHERDRDDGHEL
ncbi:type IV secretion system T-DNA border endonuclease VirD2 [Paracoccus alcaliphilus]|uniref:Type IV secretion system T-DNA border endonuclease VirD2 n=1 Tax=Paracoccus alcaliphilus TaxID=34002 RepID=A0A1H8MLI4_9RHOB|nr:relaxase/mobilization nuclease domain-containing protein [Paracoccus alcaliphilus]SEO18154.1 type IV secretion system T-DNA border endonuclease VirD2 [Paracoccus alcaliphilus]